MIEKKIKALEDLQFTNFSGTHFLVAGEVKRIKFMNQQRFEQHVQSGRMVEAGLHEKEGKIIPVVFPPKTDENVIVSVDPLDPINTPVDEAGETEEKETLEDQEQSEPSQVDPLEGIDPDKPDLPCPSEDVELEEISRRELTEAEEAILAEAKPETEAEALVALGETAEVPEELPDEFEEIPIEEWRKEHPDAPELEPDEVVDNE